MKSYHLLWFSLILMLTFMACQTEVEEMQIETDVLVKVLADVHLSEGALLSIKPSQKDSLRAVYYQQIYEIHRVTNEAFEHDMDMLKSNPKMMERIYEKVTVELNQMEKNLGAKSTETKK